MVHAYNGSVYRIKNKNTIECVGQNSDHEFERNMHTYTYKLIIKEDSPNYLRGHLLVDASVKIVPWITKEIYFIGKYDAATKKMNQFSFDQFDLIERKKYEKEHQPKKEVKLPAGPVYYVNIISVGIQSDMQWGGGSLTRVSEGGTLILLEDTKKEGRGVKEVDKKLKYFKGTWWKVCTNTGIIGYVLYDPVAKNLMPSSTSADGKK